MSQPAHKCDNNCAIFNQKYAQKLSITFKMAYSCFSFDAKLNFVNKSFITLTSCLLGLEHKSQEILEHFLFLKRLQYLKGWQIEWLAFG